MMNFTDFFLKKHKFFRFRSCHFHVTIVTVSVTTVGQKSAADPETFSVKTYVVSVVNGPKDAVMDHPPDLT